MQYSSKCVVNRCRNFTNVDKLPIYLNNASPNSLGTYRRYSNNNLKALEDTILSLYDYKVNKCTICSSGMQAFKVLLDNIGRTSSKIVVSNKCYLELRLILDYYKQYNIEFVDMNDINKFKSSLVPNSLVIVDGVDCMMLDNFNLKEIIDIAHQHNSFICVDNTVLSSYYYNPFNDNADYVVESLTKYSGGHGDVMAGVLLGFSDIKYNSLTGITLDPLSCYLLQRGISTLPLRLDRITNTSQKIYKYLKSKVKNVRYYGIGGLIVFTCGSRSKNIEFIKSLKMILNTTSFGQDNTTVSLSYKLETEYYPDIPSDYKEYIRLSVGLEDYRDIISDLELGFRMLELLKWEW